jgi:hypothetical protein
LTYDPTVAPQMAKIMVQNGLGGGAGLSYPDNSPVNP